MLTAKQSQLLLFIQERVTSSGVSPSFDEMKDALGLKSKSGVHRLINALEERGFIRRMANRARAIEILKTLDGSSSAQPSSDNVVTAPFGVSKNTALPDSGTAGDSVEIPLHGRIAAGTPIEALENHDSFISIPSGMMGRNNCFALEVSGDSMVEMGILDGDTVLIESTDTARDGEVVVALVDHEEATLKTLRMNGQFIELVPANRDYKTQVLETSRVKVQGRLVGLLRKYH